MQKDVVEATIKGVMPTGQAYAIFLGPEEKTFVIYVDPHTGNAISMAISKTKKERPLTHDLILNIFTGLGVTVERIVISHVDSRPAVGGALFPAKHKIGWRLALEPLAGHD